MKMKKKELRNVYDSFGAIRMEYELLQHLISNVPQKSEMKMLPDGETDYLTAANEISKVVQQRESVEDKLINEYEVRVKYLVGYLQEREKKLKKLRRKFKEQDKLLRSCLYKMGIDPYLKSDDLYKEVKKWKLTKARRF